MMPRTCAGQGFTSLSDAGLCPSNGLRRFRGRYLEPHVDELHGIYIETRWSYFRNGVDNKRQLARKEVFDEEFFFDVGIVVVFYIAVNAEAAAFENDSLDDDINCTFINCIYEIVGDGRRIAVRLHVELERDLSSVCRDGRGEFLDFLFLNVLKLRVKVGMFHDGKKKNKVDMDYYREGTLV